MLRLKVIEDFELDVIIRAQGREMNRSKWETRWKWCNGGTLLKEKGDDRKKFATFLIGDKLKGRIWLP